MDISRINDEIKSMQDKNRSKEIEIVDRYLGYIMEHFEELATDVRTSFEEVETVNYKVSAQLSKNKSIFRKRRVARENNIEENGTKPKVDIKSEENKEKFIILDTSKDRGFYCYLGDLDVGGYFWGIDREGNFVLDSYQYDNNKSCVVWDGERKNIHTTTLNCHIKTFSTSEMIERHKYDKIILMLSRVVRVLDGGIDIHRSVDDAIKKEEELKQLHYDDQKLTRTLNIIKNSGIK